MIFSGPRRYVSAGLTRVVVPLLGLVFSQGPHFGVLRVFWGPNDAATRRGAGLCSPSTCGAGKKG